MLKSKILLTILITFCCILFITNTYFPEWQIDYIINVFIHILQWKGKLQILNNQGEFIYIIIIAYFLYLLSGLCKSLYIYFKHNIIDPLLNWSISIINTVLICYLILFFNWNILYSSTRLIYPTIPPVYEDTLDLSQHRELLRLVNLKLNQIPYPTQQSPQYYNEIIRHTYQRKVKEELPHLNTQNSIFKSFLAIMGISGYYHPLTGESYINEEVNNALKPFIMAHEMAHQIGIAPESEANYTAYYICIESDHYELQYSAYFNVMMQCLTYIKYHDSIEYQNTLDTMNTNILKDINEINEYRRRSKSIISSYSMGFYNWFLKINNKGLGIKAYSKLKYEVYQSEIMEHRRLPNSIIYNWK